MTSEEKEGLFERMHQRIHSSHRIDACDFNEMGVTRLADAQELVDGFRDWEREHHDFSWRLSRDDLEVKVTDPETGKKVKKTVIGWKAEVDWAWRRS